VLNSGVGIMNGEIEFNKLAFAFSAENKHNSSEDETWYELMQLLPLTIVHILLEKALEKIEREEKCELPPSG
jgi:hypothetical protein